MSTQGATQGAKPRHRPALIVLAVVGALICLLMAYWQFSRWNSASGSGLNFGYALQWPFFGAFLFFIYYRFIRLEAEHETDDGSPTDAAGSGADAPATRPEQEDTQPATEIPEDILPTRRPTVEEVEAPDDAIAAYNDYLSQLNDRASNSGRSTRSTGER